MSSFKCSLISVLSLALSLKCIVLFISAFCLLQAPLVKRTQVIGNSKDGLYFLYSRYLKNKDSVKIANVNSTCSCHSSTSFLSYSFENKTPSLSMSQSCNINKCELPTAYRNESQIFHYLAPCVCFYLYQQRCFI